MTTDPWSETTTAPSGVQVHTGFWALTFLLALVRPRLELDGGPPTPQPWGDTFIWVAPGRHTVRCSFRWLIVDRAGDASVTVDVPPGHVLQLRYEAPHWFVFVPGRWTVGALQPLALDPGPTGFGPGPAESPGALAPPPPSMRAAAPLSPAAPAPPLAPAPPVAPAPQVATANPAGWFPDPGGVHDHRYWDGTRWTEHVADGGVAAFDPPPG
jgi:hypothetical protein